MRQETIGKQRLFVGKKNTRLLATECLSNKINVFPADTGLCSSLLIILS